MTKRIKKMLIGLCVLSFTQGLLSAGSMDELQKSFQTLSADDRRLTGPLFWLHGDESKQLLEDYVEKVAEGGNGCFTAESRPHNDWLGDGWYRDLKICLEAAKKNDLKMWIFDEKWWPSGEVGGMVPQQYAGKYMQAEGVDVEGGKSCDLAISEDKLIAVLAGRLVDDAIDGASLIDLTGKVSNGSLNWQVPQGNWKVMTFSWNYSHKRGNSYLVDGASQDAVDWYIQKVYQPHYDHFKEDFGSWIPGFFYDEPETYGDWGTEVIPLLKERGIDWKKALTAWKFTLAGQEQIAAKYQYRDAFAEAWGRTLFGGITKWCHEHKVRSIGHFLEHDMLYMSDHFCAGNMFQLQKYSDMGAIDAVFAQFKMAKRETHGDLCWQTPKLASSISHVYNKPDDIAMVEIFGARGQDLTYPEMKWWTDHMQVSGINFHIPHSFNPKSPYDTDCPPYFYNNGHEPRWPLYRVYADYTSRLSLMLSGGYHVCPVAFLYAGNSVHVGKFTAPDEVSEALQDAMFDCDWMPYDVFEDQVKVGKKTLKMREEQYKVLIMPPVEVIPYETLKKAYDFFAAGGVVLAYERLPELAADLGRDSTDIEVLREKIWGNAQAGSAVCKVSKAGGRSYFLPAKPSAELFQQVITGDAGVHPTLEVLKGDTGGSLHVLHRVKDGSDVFFICNQNVDGGKRKFDLRIKAAGYPEYWDAMRNEIMSVPFTRSGENVEMALELDELESCLLVFNKSKRKLPALYDTAGVKPIQSLAVTTVESEKKEAAGIAVEVLLDGCSWIWASGENAAVSALPGYCYFRNSFDIPANSQLAKARLIATADNEMGVFVNGNALTAAGDAFAAWGQISDIDITSMLGSGSNTVAISVLNATDKASPAGLIGKIVLTFADGSERTVFIDKNWKADKAKAQNWEKPGFDDSGWSYAGVAATYGSGPWGTFGQQLTLSPVNMADPYTGEFELSKKYPGKNYRVVLAMDDIQPETAARITVNGKYAGGCIGKLLYKDISDYVQAGNNTVCIEPFSPGSVKILIFSR